MGSPISGNLHTVNLDLLKMVMVVFSMGNPLPGESTGNILYFLWVPSPRPSNATDKHLVNLPEAL